MNNKSEKVQYLVTFCENYIDNDCIGCPIYEHDNELCLDHSFDEVSEMVLDVLIEKVKSYEEKQKDVADNQNNKNDSGKLKISLVPPTIIWDIAQVREYGNRKYNSPDGWKTVEPQRYIDALLRHTIEFMRDPRSVDAESGIEHYKHMACNLAFLCEFWRDE